MKFLRLMVYALLGYTFGYALGTCSKSMAQSPANELIHLNSLNTVTLRGPVESDSISALEIELNAAIATRHNKTYPIYLVVDSPGGDLVEGLSFIEHAKVLSNIRTVTIFAASMASGIVEGLPGLRLITGNGQLMFHRAAGGFSGYFEIGEVESRLAMAQNMVLGMENTNAKRLGLTLEEYKRKAITELWIPANTAIQQKAADKVIDIVCSQELVDSRKEVVVESMFGSSEYIFSGCPTIRSPLKSDKKSGVTSI